MSGRPPALPPPRPSIAALLRDPRGVRAAVIVAEILGPPAALR